MKRKLKFTKYQASGNDFILIDHRSPQEPALTRSEIALLCHRRFGIGADGLILLNSLPGYDFEMKNYNSDGGECSMCGNGGRALIQFARDSGIVKDHYRFMAIDGIHEARFEHGGIELKMKDVSKIIETPVGPTLDTGSPHLVVPIEGTGSSGLLQFEVVKEGRALRNSPLFMPGGINVNFFEIRSGNVFVRTYERGVEDETLSCGTGAIATAMIVARDREDFMPGLEVRMPVHCQGGELEVRFTLETTQAFRNIWLKGPVERTFTGET